MFLISRIFFLMTLKSVALYFLNIFLKYSVSRAKGGEIGDTKNLNLKRNIVSLLVFVATAFKAGSHYVIAL